MKKLLAIMGYFLFIGLFVYGGVLIGVWIKSAFDIRQSEDRVFYTMICYAFPIVIMTFIGLIIATILVSIIDDAIMRRRIKNQEINNSN